MSEGDFKFGLRERVRVLATGARGTVSGRDQYIYKGNGYRVRLFNATKEPEVRYTEDELESDRKVVETTVAAVDELPSYRTYAPAAVIEPVTTVHAPEVVEPETEEQEPADTTRVAQAGDAAS